MKLFALALAFVPTVALAGNYATCLLDKLPGIENDPAANAAMRFCVSKYPGGFTNVPQGAGLGLFSYDNGAECAMKKGGATRSHDAGRLINMACNKLYNKPQNAFDLFDQKP